jgi:hypothetical protein
VKKYFIAMASLCAALLSTNAQATSDKPHSIAACKAALEKKGIKATGLSAITTEFRGNGSRAGAWATVKGKVNIASDPGASFVCEIHNNAVISLTIGH